MIDLVAEGGKLGIVMQFVQRGDLRRYIADRGRLSTSRTCALMAQVAAGLGAAHTAGVVHRDLKPENVLIDTADEQQPLALITDFGVAHLADQPSLTRPSGFLGTPAYTAPETAAGERPTGAVDIYAAGVMAYELVSGHLPFDAENVWAMLKMHLEDVAPRPPGVSDALWHVITSCLAKDLSERPDAPALARALAALTGDIGRPFTDYAPDEPTTIPPDPLPHSPPPPSPSPPDDDLARPGRPLRKRITALAVGVVAALGAGGVWLAVRPSPSVPTPPPTIGVSSNTKPSSPDAATAAAQGGDWVRFTFNEQGLGTAGASRQFKDTSGHDNRGLVRVAPPGVLTVIPHDGNGRAIRFPEPCAPTAGSACPRAVVQTADPSSLNPGGGDFTYGADVLVEPAQAKESFVIQQGRTSRSYSRQWSLQLDSDGRPSCVMAISDSGAPHTAQSTVTIADGIWHRVKCARVAGQLTISVDDSPPAGVPVPPDLIFDTDAPFRLGGTSNQQDNGQFFGALDNVFFRLGAA